VADALRTETAKASLGIVEKHANHNRSQIGLLGIEHRRPVDLSGVRAFYRARRRLADRESGANAQWEGY